MAVTTSQWKARQPARLPVRWRKRPKKRPPKTRTNNEGPTESSADVVGSEADWIALGDDEQGQSHSNHRLSPDDGESPG